MNLSAAGQRAVARILGATEAGALIIDVPAGNPAAVQESGLWLNPEWGTRRWAQERYGRVYIEGRLHFPIPPLRGLDGPDFLRTWTWVTPEAFAARYA